jgi:PAS domain S-box-containing protein
MAVVWVVLLAVAALVLSGLGVYAWRHRGTRGAGSFGLLMFAVAGYSLTYGLELLARELPAKMLWIRAEYPFIVAIPVLWLVFSVKYTDHGAWLSRRNLILLALVPSTTTLLVWTNPIHHLYYTVTDIQAMAPWALLHVEYGPWFWIHITYSYGCLLAGTFLVASAYLRAHPLYRRQAAVLLVGALIPWLGNLIYLARATPWPDLDLTPLAFTASGLVVGFGLFRYRLLQVVPVARRAAVEGMATAMVVLDAEGRVADLNPAAERLFGLMDRDVIGHPARQVLGPPELVERFLEMDRGDAEVAWEEGSEQRVSRVSISPVDGGVAGAPPRVVLITDITEQTRARSALTETNRRLLALQDSTAELTALMEPRALFDQVMDQLERLLPFQRALLGLYDEDDDSLTYVASRGLDREEVTRLERSALERHPGWVVKHRAPMLVTDTETDPRVEYSGSPRNRSLVLVPVLYEERCLGILGLGSTEPRAYTAADQDLLTAFANQVAVSLEKARLYEETHRWADRLRVLYEVATAAATAGTLDEMLQRTVRTIQQAMGPDEVTLFLLEPGTRELVMRARVGCSEGSPLIRRKAGEGIPGWVLQSGEATLVPDVREDERYPACEEETRSEICVPLRVGDQIIGALDLGSQEPGAFEESDLRILTTLARHLAVIIENARLGEEAKDRAEALGRRGRHLELLHEIGRVAASTLELPELCQALADALAQIIGGDGCFITHIDEAAAQVLGGVVYGSFADSQHPMQTPPDELALAEVVFRADHPLVVEDVFDSPYFTPTRADRFPGRSMLGLSMRVGERELGACLIVFDDEHKFAEEEITWARQAVDLAALALDNARLYQEVRAWATRLEQRVEARTQELRETQAQLLHAEKLAALGQLSASIAHEIGQPLALIDGYVDLLAEDHPDHASLSPIQDAIEQLSRLLVQLRDFSRPAAEEWSWVAIHEVMDRVLALAGKELARRRIRVRHQTIPDLPEVIADARQLEQVFLNLILNARDAMEEGGELAIRTFQTGNQVVAEFADTGSGIDPESLDRIFEPYYTTKQDKGTGLGLAICHRIVEAHSGRIEVTSLLGQGTSFRVYLPMASTRA